MRARANRGYARGPRGGDPAGGGGGMPGTGPALDHGGDAVELRRVRAVEAFLPLSGKFENLREDVRRWGWVRSLFIRVVSALRRYIGLHIYRINVRPLATHSPERYLPSGITVRIVTPEELFRAANDPELDLSLDFVRS